MTRLATVALATTVLVDEQLLPAPGADDLGDHPGAPHARRANLDVLPVGNQQDLGELDGLAQLPVELLDAERFPLLHPVLLSTGGDDGVHGDVSRLLDCFSC